MQFQADSAASAREFGMAASNRLTLNGLGNRDELAARLLSSVSGTVGDCKDESGGALFQGDGRHPIQVQSSMII